MIKKYYYLRSINNVQSQLGLKILHKLSPVCQTWNISWQSQSKQFLSCVHEAKTMQQSWSCDIDICFIIFIQTILSKMFLDWPWDLVMKETDILVMAITTVTGVFRLILCDSLRCVSFDCHLKSSHQSSFTLTMFSDRKLVPSGNQLDLRLMSSSHTNSTQFGKIDVRLEHPSIELYFSTIRNILF